MAGGFAQEDQVESSNPNIDATLFEAKHEEADTRIILHCIRSEARTIVVAARDTDILILLLAHFHKMPFYV